MYRLNLKKLHFFKNNIAMNLHRTVVARTFQRHFVFGDSCSCQVAMEQSYFEKLISIVTGGKGVMKPRH
jgi:hypothetical protein